VEFYAKMRATADKILRGKGQAITLTRQSSGTYAPSTGLATVSTSTQTGYGAVFEYGGHNAVFEYGDHNIDGTLVKAGDKQLLLSALNSTGTALTTPPIVNDTATIGGAVYTITSVKPLSPAGTTCIFECNLRTN
jgi:hypothetical protein